MAQHYSSLAPDVAYSSLHDDFLEDIHATVGSLHAFSKPSRLAANTACTYTCQKLGDGTCDVLARAHCEKLEQPTASAVQHWTRSSLVGLPAVGATLATTWHLTASTALQGMSEFAAEIGIIDETGQLPGVRVQGTYAHFSVSSASL